MRTEDVMRDVRLTCVQISSKVDDLIERREDLSDVDFEKVIDLRYCLHQLNLILEMNQNKRKEN